MRTIPKEVSLPVRPIEVHLQEQYADLIDMGDCENVPEIQRTDRFRTRALTALVLGHLSGAEPDVAADCVIDDFHDNGIDGIAVSPDRKHIWLVQTKWSDQGKGVLDQNAVFAIREGTELILDREYDAFNDRLHDDLRAELDTAMSRVDLRVTVVLCLLGTQKIAPFLEAKLQAYLDKLNEHDPSTPMAQLRTLHLPDIREIVAQKIAGPAVRLTVDLLDWGRLGEPFDAYYGCVPATEITAWYEEAGERLFAKNIRGSLGTTEVNRQIRFTLEHSPDVFWYLNNGITVLCDSWAKAPIGGGNRALGKFELSGASVVNGAQTVRTIHDAVRKGDGGAGSATVWVRIISLEHCPPDFAHRITEATNTQNEVAARDFISLEAAQISLRKAFATDLGKIYTIKRDDAVHDPEAGCSIVELAQALACVHADATFAARAYLNRSNPDTGLWDRGPQGTYDILFARRLSADRAWALVCFLRAVSAAVGEAASGREGRALRVVASGTFLITHVLWQHATDRQRQPDPPETNWPDLLAHVERLVDLLVVTIDRLFTEHAVIPLVFGDAERCSQLSAVALEHLESGSTVVELPDAYRTTARSARRTRRANAVTVLIDNAVLRDGTRLLFRPVAAKDAAALNDWLAGDERRAVATWVNNRSKPLLWAADGQHYSPSMLARAMREEAGLRRIQVQGPRYWHTADGRSLVDLADEVRQDDTD